MFKRWIIFALLCLGYILVYFHRLCAGIVATDMMRDLAAGGILTGLLGAAYFYPYALMQLPAGLLSDSWGPRTTLTALFLIAALGSFILGFSVNVATAFIGRLLVGLGVAMLFVPTMKVLSRWFNKDEYSLMAGILVAMGGVGLLTATTPLAHLSNALGWRFSFIIIGILTLIITVFIWFFVADAPDSGRLNNANGLSGKELKNAIKHVLTTPAFWPLAGWFFFICAVFFAFGGLWGAPYLMHVYHLSKLETGNIISMLAFGMIIGSPLFGFLSDRLFKSRKVLLVLCSVLSCILMFVLWFYVDSLSMPLLYLICFGLGLSTNAIVSIGFTSAKELFDVKIAGTAIGLINFFPFAAGAIFQQIIGAILEKYGKIGDAFKPEGYKMSFLVLFVCAAASLTASVFTKETFKKK